MTEYKLSPKAISGYARAGMIRTTMLMLALLIALLAIIYFSPAESEGTVLYLEIVLPLFLLAWFILLFNTRKRITRSLGTIQIFVGDEVVRKRVEGVPDIVIPYREVSEIRRKTDGSIMVVGPNENVFMIIPVGMEGESSLQEELQAVRELVQEEHEEEQKQRRIPLFPFVLIGLVLYQIAENKWVLLLGGGMLAMVVVVAVFRAWANHDIPLTVRRLIWLFLLLAAYILYETFLRFQEIVAAA